MKNHLPTVLLMTNYPGFGGGAEQQLASLAIGIDKKRFRVLLAALHDGNFVPWQIPEVKCFSLKSRGKYDFLPVFRLAKILAQNRVDIIQPFLSPSTLFGLLPAFLVRTPVRVVTERCGVRNNPGLGYKLTAITEDFLGRFAEIAVANSISGQNMLIDRGFKPEKTMVIYNGLEIKRLAVDPALVDKIRAEHGLKPGQPVVGIAAWISPPKDHPGFIRAAEIILKSNPEVRFAILGDGITLPQLKEMVKDMGLTGKVFFMGRQTQVGSYLSVFDISVLSSIDHEGCSNSILESMYLGKPVVATDVGGNKELVKPGENGTLVPPRNPQALADAILDLINDPQKARLMGERGRAMVVAGFSQERMVTLYQELWLKLLEKKRPREVVTDAAG